MKTTKYCRNMCHLPLPHKALVLNHCDHIEVVSCETGHQLWELEGEVDRKKLQAGGVTLYPELQLLLVADDYPNCRILVLDPGSGTLTQSIIWPLEEIPQDFTWRRDQLLLHQQTHMSHIQLVYHVTGVVDLVTIQ